MGTRCIILVTGKPCSVHGHKTIRLYKHWDGDPKDTLRILLEAVKTSKRLVYARQRFEPKTMDSDLPAVTMADLIIGASIGWEGAEARVDTDGFHDARFRDRLQAKHFGDAFDLEWVYIVDVQKQVVMVYSAGDGTPREHVVNGPVNPLDWAETCPVEREGDAEWKDKMKTLLAALMDQLMEEGWSINDLKYKPPFRKK